MQEGVRLGEEIGGIQDIYTHTTAHWPYTMAPQHS